MTLEELPLTLRNMATTRERGGQIDPKRLRRIADDIAQEIEDDEKLRSRMAALLDGVANAIHGDPGENASHSWHDLPELVAAMKAELVRHGPQDLAGRW